VRLAKRKFRKMDFHVYSNIRDRLCSLLFRVPDYRSKGPGFDSCATRFSEKYGSGTSLSLVRLTEELLE
jgi:hypothetical protein